MRVLFVSDEVAPFTNKSELAPVVRSLPEMLHENAGVETRIMMPRYGIVSERRNRLHEVIRLSGSEISTGDGKESLKVKVASIPGIRLQVYFMDNVHMFKRKGIFADKTGKLFPDNAERAIFYAKAVLQTISNLGWKPDVVHAFGWLSGMVPHLLKTEYAEHELFAEAKVVFTPQATEFEAPLTEKMVSDFELTGDGLVGNEPDVIGVAAADASIFLPGHETTNGAEQFGEDEEANMNLAAAVYERIQAGVPA
ncbi:MAG: glycogen/starch synthase [Rhodothermales bacterium]|nr:glycogen/starch synthase [Rhodothermales bacterium]MBO6779829.1 glycogen/starch synthase [Rhodothermales bacterium]